jgi:glutamyl-tRNA reductase
MRLLAIGCNYRNSPLELRERLAFDETKLALALEELNSRYDCETVIIATCNRIELYLARPSAINPPDPELVTEFLAECHHLDRSILAGHFYQFHDAEAVRHLFRVVAGLDSMIIGEAQITGQVKRAYELAKARATVGPLFNALFQRAARVAGRVRSETGLSQGHVSVSSAAVEYVRQVFDHFGDKTVLVIGAGKIGELTLRHLRELQPRRILLTNRNLKKAVELAGGCGGTAVPWEELDHVLATADIVLSTTGSQEPIVSRERYDKIQARRSGGSVVIFDMAVPRDFDPQIHDGDRTFVFNIDDLQRFRERKLQERLKHAAGAEAIVEQEQQRFITDWNRRRHGPVIARLTEEFEAKRKAIVSRLMDRLDGRLGAADRAYIEGAFRLYQNQVLHGPISALTEESHESGGHTLLEALAKLFRLHD